MRKRVAAVIGLLALLTVTGAYVWPTPYEHYKMGSVNLRVNRFTGATDRLTVGGWEPSDPVRAYLTAKRANPSAAAMLDSTAKP